MDEKQETFSCEFCQKVLSTKQSLKLHINTNKKCLRNRGIDLSSKESIKCKNKGCIYSSFLKQDMDKHLSTCKKNKKSIKDENIQDRLINLVEKLSKKPSIINNTTNSNTIINNLRPIPINEEYMKGQAQYLTIDHIKRGSIGYSDFILDHPLRDAVVCTDFARRKVKYKDEDGDIITDPDMYNILYFLFNSIKEKNIELTKQYVEELLDKIKNENKEYFELLLNRFTDQDIKFFEMLKGVKNELYHEIVKLICTKTIKL